MTAMVGGRDNGYIEPTNDFGVSEPTAYQAASHDPGRQVKLRLIKSLFF